MLGPFILPTYLLQVERYSELSPELFSSFSSLSLDNLIYSYRFLFLIILFVFEKVIHGRRTKYKRHKRVCNGN